MSIFSQLLKVFPRSEFEQLVRQTRAERHARGFACWDQFVAMLFCQLGRAQSLREICGGLSSCEGKLVHLGVSAPSAVASRVVVLGIRLAGEGSRQAYFMANASVCTQGSLA
jgi:hypothetical protein